MFRDILDFHRELIWRSPWRHVNTMIDLDNTRKQSALLNQKKNRGSLRYQSSYGSFNLACDPTPTPPHFKAFVRPPIPPIGYSPFWGCMEVRTVRMSTKLDIHTSFIQASSIVVYFSRVCGLDRRPKRSVKHIVHCMQPHSVCLRKSDTLWINLNLKPLLISVIMFTKCIASCSSKVNITLDRSRGIESLLILAPCLCSSVLVVIALMP